MIRWWRRREPRADFESGTVEVSPGYRRYLAAAAWSGGSARDWDHSVRPVLAELVELVLAERNLSGEPAAAGRELLGEQLWALVDRDAPRSTDRFAPGPGRDALDRILDRLDGG